MKVVIQPFYSQQDKDTHRFLLDADVTTDISRFLAEQLRLKGWEVALILPAPADCVGGWPKWVEPFTVYMPAYVPHENKFRRLSFDSTEMAAMLEGADLFITLHELVAFKVRQLVGKRTKIIHFNILSPLGEWEWMEPLQQASWAAADLVPFLAENLQRFAQARVQRIALWNYQDIKWTVWPTGYDARPIVFREPAWPGKIDLLFVQRCSSSNYTHHREFIEAIHLLRTQLAWQGRVMFTDPTHYLELNKQAEAPTGIDLDSLKIEFAHAGSRADYYELLSQSKVAVAMMSNDLHGGVAIREAIASGCIPVLLDEPCYREMLRPHALAWPYLVHRPIGKLDLAHILQDALDKQSQWQFRTDFDLTLNRIREKIERESYQRAWREHIWPDISTLMGSVQ